MCFLSYGTAKNSYQGANDWRQMQNQGHEDCFDNGWLASNTKDKATDMTCYDLSNVTFIWINHEHYFYYASIIINYVGSCVPKLIEHLIGY